MNYTLEQKMKFIYQLMKRYGKQKTVTKETLSYLESVYVDYEYMVINQDRKKIK
jgi:hypothetical protein